MLADDCNLLKLLPFRAFDCLSSDPALLSRLLISTEADCRGAASILIVGCSFLSYCKAAVNTHVRLALSRQSCFRAPRF
jgi:hypothetical protein